jgi:hypothetical protein
MAGSWILKDSENQGKEKQFPAIHSLPKQFPTFILQNSAVISRKSAFVHPIFQAEFLRIFSLQQSWNHLLQCQLKP